MDYNQAPNVSATRTPGTVLISKYSPPHCLDIPSAARYKRRTHVSTRTGSVAAGAAFNVTTHARPTLHTGYVHLLLLPGRWRVSALSNVIVPDVESWSLASAWMVGTSENHTRRPVQHWLCRSFWSTPFRHLPLFQTFRFLLFFSLSLRNEHGCCRSWRHLPGSHFTLYHAYLLMAHSVAADQHLARM